MGDKEEDAQPPPVVTQPTQAAPPPGPPPVAAPPPGPPPMAYQQPGMPPMAYQQPGMPPTAYQQPGMPPTAYQQPGMPPTVYQQPGMPPTMAYQQSGMTPTMAPRPGMIPLPPGTPVPPPLPDPIPGCPPGLEYLTQVDKVLCRQKMDILEVVTEWEIANKYTITNRAGQQIYFATEESSACQRQSFKMNRGFKMHILDNYQQEVMRVTRDFKCCATSPCALCFPNAQPFRQEVYVEAPLGVIVGRVRRAFSCGPPKFVVVDENENEMYTMEGPICFIQAPCCPGDIEFIVRGMDSNEVGKCAKEYAGYFEEQMSNADNFSASFPIELDVKLKAIMIGALFLLDFMFFEDDLEKDKPHHHHHHQPEHQFITIG